MAHDLVQSDEIFSARGIKNIIVEELECIKHLRVVDEDSYKKVTGLYAEARRWKKIIEAIRKEILEPFRKLTIAINEKAKSLSNPIDQIILLANKKAAGYSALLEKERIEEEKRLSDAAKLFDSEEEVYLPQSKINNLEKEATFICKTEKRFKVVDMELIPRKYLTIDERAIKQDLVLGIQQIPGLEIYEEKITILRTK